MKKLIIALSLLSLTISPLALAQTHRHKCPPKNKHCVIQLPPGDPQLPTTVTFSIAIATNTLKVVGTNASQTITLDLGQNSTTNAFFLNNQGTFNYEINNASTDVKSINYIMGVNVLPPWILYLPIQLPSGTYNVTFNAWVGTSSGTRSANITYLTP